MVTYPIPKFMLMYSKNLPISMVMAAYKNVMSKVKHSVIVSLKFFLNTHWKEFYIYIYGFKNSRVCFVFVLD